jgi:hypothetical protein
MQFASQQVEIGYPIYHSWILKEILPGIKGLIQSGTCTPVKRLNFNWTGEKVLQVVVSGVGRLKRGIWFRSHIV